MKRILIIEDDKKIAAALSLRLSAAGYEVLMTSHGSQGLKLATQEKPDLILMDIWIPGGTGFSVAERLSNQGLASIPIIFMTASKKEELWKMAQEIGAAGFFQKPYDPEKLLEAIAHALVGAPMEPAFGGPAISESVSEQMQAENQTVPHS
jgi:DNA-binding response OmpR family regulator